ncbi:uncharacterized protein LOC122389939 [Amphibalanus amphitrite]|uniref:uncharacterized protein LOC122389939 n=1 Tax=Amphibalanus amphitrite TaxID=1232801 RepID=UPI001C928665|nr:uncharacterized protein LOC122389939 [Amphibalanus amphitrite]
MHQGSGANNTGAPETAELPQAGGGTPETAELPQAGGGTPETAELPQAGGGTPETAELPQAGGGTPETAELPQAGGGTPETAELPQAGGGTPETAELPQAGGGTPETAELPQAGGGTPETAELPQAGGGTPETADLPQAGGGTPETAELPQAGAPETAVLPQAGGLIVDERGEERCSTCQAPAAAEVVMEELEHRVDELELQLAATKKRTQEEDTNMLKVLTVSQLRALKTGKRPKTWDDDSLTKALGMRASMSVKLYNYLRLKMRLVYFNDKIGITLCSNQIGLATVSNSQAR